MSPVFQAVRDTFTKMNWESHEVPGREVVEAAFEAHHTRIPLHVQAFPPLNAISVVAQASQMVPESRRGVISEMLMRTNRELTIGNFELDYESGVVLFRATNIFPKAAYPHQVIASLVHSAIAEMDRLTPFLSLLLQMDTKELATLNLKLFLMREDLLPPVKEED